MRINSQNNLGLRLMLLPCLPEQNISEVTNVQDLHEMGQKSSSKGSQSLNLKLFLNKNALVHKCLCCTVNTYICCITGRDSFMSPYPSQFLYPT